MGAPSLELNNLFRTHKERKNLLSRMEMGKINIKPKTKHCVSRKKKSPFQYRCKNSILPFGVSVCVCGEFKHGIMNDLLLTVMGNEASENWTECMHMWNRTQILIC